MTPAGVMSSSKRELDGDVDTLPALEAQKANGRKIKRLTMLTRRAAGTPPAAAAANGAGSSARRRTSSSSEGPDPLTNNGVTPGHGEGLNFEPSGLLDQGPSRAVFVDGEYQEPEDKCVATKFRFYTFEDHDDIKDTLSLNQQSKYTVGGGSCDVRVEGAAGDGPRAVLQIRKPAGSEQPRIYLVALAEGCSVNGAEAAKNEFVELHDKDTLRFGGEKDFLLVEE